MSHKVRSSQGNVPFSWENKPGVTKKNQDDHDHPKDSGHPALKLPPPPCPPPENNSRTHHFHDLQVPLPPCGFQPPSRSGSRRGIKKQDDPFLSAYMECTKTSTRKGKKLLIGGGKSGFGFGLRKSVSVFSCKNSCSTVRDDSMVRISQLPISKPEREGEEPSP